MNPVFCCLFGLSIALKYKVKRKANQQQKIIKNKSLTSDYNSIMGRKSLAPGEETEHLGVKLPASVVRDLIAIGKTMDDAAKSTVARKLLLLGKAVYESCQAMGIRIDLDEVPARAKAEAAAPILINKASGS